MKKFSLFTFLILITTAANGWTLSWMCWDDFDCQTIECTDNIRMQAQDLTVTDSNSGACSQFVTKCAKCTNSSNSSRYVMISDCSGLNSNYTGVTQLQSSPIYYYNNGDCLNFDEQIHGLSGCDRGFYRQKYNLDKRVYETTDIHEEDFIAHCYCPQGSYIDGTNTCTKCSDGKITVGSDAKQCFDITWGYVDKNYNLLAGLPKGGGCSLNVSINLSELGNYKCFLDDPAQSGSVQNLSSSFSNITKSSVLACKTILDAQNNNPFGNEINMYCTCPAGYYMSDNGCIQCSGNTYSSTSNSSKCQPCPNNSTSNSAHTACSCNKGYYSRKNMGCIKCGTVAGLYLSENIQTSKEAELTTTAAGATTESQCILPVGTYYDARGTIINSGISCPQ